jgi:hypothetical protein
MDRQEKSQIGSITHVTMLSTVHPANSSGLIALTRSESGIEEPHPVRFGRVKTTLESIRIGPRLGTRIERIGRPIDDEPWRSVSSPAFFT